MDDPIATDIDVEFEAAPTAVLELNEEWIAYLESQPVPGQIEGVDAGISYTSDSSTEMA